MDPTAFVIPCLLAGVALYALPGGWTYMPP